MIDNKIVNLILNRNDTFYKFNLFKNGEGVNQSFFKIQTIYSKISLAAVI